jgi:hypothetical protein
MLSAKDCLRKYGPPAQDNPFLTLWDVPSALEIGVIPKKIYCNRDLIQPLTAAFQALIQTGHVAELLTWDGCFNIRNVRGKASPSLHSWGVAIDMNAANNPLGLTRTQIVARGLKPFSPGFLSCFRSNGFDCGADWTSRPDFMHFQLSRI